MDVSGHSESIALERECARTYQCVGICTHGSTHISSKYVAPCSQKAVLIMQWLTMHLSVQRCTRQYDSYRLSVYLQNYRLTHMHPCVLMCTLVCVHAYTCSNHLRLRTCLLPIYSHTLPIDFRRHIHTMLAMGLPLVEHQRWTIGTRIRMSKEHSAKPLSTARWLQGGGLHT